MSKYTKLVQKYKEITKKECYEIKIIDDGEPGILDNKIGGKPYLPVGVEWPVDSTGSKMNLLFQVNLKDIKLDNFPEAGILEIFASEIMDWPDECKIFIFEEGLEYQTNLPEQYMEEFYIIAPHKININKRYEHMPMSNEESDKILCKLLENYLNISCKSRWDIKDDEYYNEIYDEITKSNIGGYPDFVQDNSGDYNSQKDICILKLDDTSHDDLYIGDCGILRVIVPKEDLKNKNFDNAYLDWDCC